MESEDQQNEPTRPTRAIRAPRSRRRPWRGLVVAASVAAFAIAPAGCSSLATLDGMPQTTGAIRTAAKPSDLASSPPREHTRILASYGGAYRDARLEAVVAGVVDKLVAASERPDAKYRVTILDSPALNAFALPSGDLYVTRGLVALANDTSELAAVLAHEMAHVIARHSAIRDQQARRAALAASAVADATGDTTGALALAKTKLALANFSRSQEFEADGIGVGIAARAGYDPKGAPRILTSMGRFAALRSASGRDPRSLDFLSSHPATPERIENALANAREHRAGQRDKAAFLAVLDGLVFGEDPVDGFVRERVFAHPKLGFAFTAPEGFTLENTSQSVIGSRANGEQVMRLDIVRPSAEQTLAAYLSSGWIDGIDPASIEETTIAGFAAVTATAKSDAWWFRLGVLRYGEDMYRFVYAAKAHSEAADKSFRASLQTFRRLSLADARAGKSLRLAVVTVKPDDTAERLATRMATPDRALERFRVLNGLAPGEQPKPGDRVKLVVE